MKINKERNRRELNTYTDQLEHLTAILEMTTDFVATVERDGNVLYFNSAARKLLGIGANEDVSKINLFDYYPECIRELLKQKAFLEAKQKGIWQGETTIIDKDDLEVTFSQVVLAHKDEYGEVQYYSTIARDITDAKIAQEKALLADKALDHINNGITITDVNGTIIRVNRAFTEVTGYQEEEVIGKTPSILSSGMHDKAFYEAMWSEILDKGSWTGEIWNRHKNGEVYLQQITIKAIKDEHGKTIYYVSVVEDITEKKQLQEQIAYQAYHDTLTQLPNRYYFNMKLEEEIQSNTSEIAILLLDLDRFKRINDTLGHVTGDQLLRAVAERLVRYVADRGLVSHLSGDDYIMYFPNLSAELALKEAEGILEELRRSFYIDRQEFFIGGSIGISIYPKDGMDTNTLLKKADLALHRAKGLGRNNAQLFSDTQGNHSLEMLSLENSMHKALELDQFELYYQPQLDINRTRIVGAEILIRWIHPERGIIPPMQFIPIAEDSGLIVKLDELVLRKGCQQWVAWKEQGYPMLRISVNLSMLNFNQGNIVTRIFSILEETGMDPKYLTIELTESALMNNPDVGQLVLSALAEKGIQISLDDFGTGYSSLAYLRKLPIHCLKIDRSFIRDLAEEEDSEALVRTIIHLSHSLQITVVAEGVETKEQLQMLKEAGCNEAQGYLISRPIPQSEFVEKYCKQQTIFHS